MAYECGFIMRLVCKRFAAMKELKFKKGTRVKAERVQDETAQNYLAVMFATRFGHLSVLKWLLAMKAFRLNEHVFALAASGGHLAVLEWLHKETICPWNHTAFRWAMQHGKLEVLEWLKKNGAAWSGECISLAMIRGDLDSLRWAWTNGYYFDLDAYKTWAANDGFLEVLKWLVDEMRVQLNDEIALAAARHGRLEILKWIRSRQNLEAATWCYDMITAAAQSGSIETLEYLRDTGAQWHHNAWTKAANSGKLHVLKWLSEKGCPAGETREDLIAAAYGNRQIVKWLRSLDFSE